MEMTQMNTRLSLDLKRQGDEVLARYGKTVSDVMRAVWRDMVDRQCVPECALGTEIDDAVAEEAFAAKRAQIAAGSGLIAAFYADWDMPRFANAMSRDELRELQYESAAEEYAGLGRGGSAGQVSHG